MFIYTDTVILLTCKDEDNATNDHSFAFWLICFWPNLNALQSHGRQNYTDQPQDQGDDR